MGERDMVNTTHDQTLTKHSSLSQNNGITQNKIEVRRKVHLAINYNHSQNI